MEMALPHHVLQKLDAAWMRDRLHRRPGLSKRVLVAELLERALDEHELLLRRKLVAMGLSQLEAGEELGKDSE